MNQEQQHFLRHWFTGLIQGLESIDERSRDDVLRAFDGQLHGGLRFGPGKRTDAYVQNWSKAADFISWPVRLNGPATFEVEAVYDAEGPSAGGAFTVAVGPHELTGAVEQGRERVAVLGQVTLDGGAFEIRIIPRRIAGRELMRLRQITLRPVSLATSSAIP